ncbi:MAG TPA: isoprenylcysteine carboxylmethyltransferase family protein [Gemmatimonadaceae bacterium]|nr:isoprenylcysteine carboxylmethyltransferase family protein [Gemmatimonadaceae bacterium]
MTILRHLLAILLLPFMVVAVIPRWLLRGWAMSDTRWSSAAINPIGHIVGVLIFLGGFALFTWCISLFARVGRGTLAPWDPTQRLVVIGPYRYVRNPMISGVVTMLIGETIFHGSRVLAIWAVTFVVFNYAFFLGFEEPDLERRFGDDYRRYKAAVPRWIPRRTAWSG